MSNVGVGGLPFAINYADIIFANHVLDPSGQNPKKRRVVMLTPDARLAAGYPIVAAGITSSLHNITSDHVLLPYKNPPGTKHPVTGLIVKSAVFCPGLVIVDPNNILGVSGFTPPSNMRLIEQKAGAAAKALGGWP